MDSSFSRSVRAVWLARWQEIAPKITFWLILAGYDVRDRSRSDLFYIPYLAIFWFVWAFATFTALSGAGAILLQMLNRTAPALAAVALIFWALVGWFLFALFQATRRSPLIFSPADAALLCQSPVDRRAVALVWFLSEWPISVLPHAVATMVAGFALFEIYNPVESINPAAVIGYWQSGLRALSVLLPLHWLLLALAWAVGAWRLHGRRDRPFLRWLPLLVALLFVPLLVARGQGGPFGVTGVGWQRLLSWPLLAGFGETAWGPAIIGAGGGALAGLALLLRAARNLNLSRAAHETSRLYSERRLARVGAREAARRLKQERMLGAGRRRTVIPAGAGWRALLWKEVTRGARTWRQGWFPWLRLLALSIGLVAAPDWGSRLTALAFWAYFAANRSTAALGDNVAHWWLWQQQPFTSRQLATAVLAPPAVLLFLLTLVAWPIGAGLPLARDFAIGPLLPLLSIQVTLAAAWDLLRNVRPATILEGRVPSVTIVGWLLGLALAAASLGLAWVVAGASGVWWMAIVAGALLSLALIAALLWLLGTAKPGGRGSPALAALTGAVRDRLLKTIYGH